MVGLLAAGSLAACAPSDGDPGHEGRVDHGPVQPAGAAADPVVRHAEGVVSAPEEGASIATATLYGAQVGAQTVTPATRPGRTKRPATRQERPAAALAQLPGAALSPPAGCEEVAEQLKATLAATMTKSLESNRAWMLDIAESVDCSDPSTWWTLWDDDCDVDGIADADGDGLVDSAEATEYSTTNNQVASVDEADFVKNDAGFIYILTGDRLAIIDAWPPEEATEIGSFPIEGATPRKLFVHDERAFIYSAVGGQAKVPCTYGYDCDFTGDGSHTRSRWITCPPSEPA